MFMVIKEDIENLIFKCEKVIETNDIKYERNKKEVKTLEKVLNGYEVNEDNKIIYNEISSRYADLVLNQYTLREENKWLRNVKRKLLTLDSKNVIEKLDPIESDTEEIIPEIEE